MKEIITLMVRQSLNFAWNINALEMLADLESAGEKSAKIQLNDCLKGEQSSKQMKPSFSRGFKSRFKVEQSLEWKLELKKMPL